VTTAEAEIDERQLWDAVRIANVPTLLMVLVHMTGDLRWLDDPYRPSRTRGLEDNDTGGLPDEIQLEIRTAAMEAIVAWRRGTPLAIERPDGALLTRMMSTSVGRHIEDSYASIIAHDLRVFDEEPPVLEVPPGCEVLVIGAGISGICAGVRLAERGVPYTIVERNQAIGGTWLENRYPGCGVDTPSHLYSFGFARSDWSLYFSLRDELRDYLSRVADDFGVTRNVRFGTEVTSAVYDPDRQRWAVELRSADGSAVTLHPNFVISAVGAFNKPVIPPLPGVELFEGPSAHTARWPEDGIELADMRVAVVGTGASAMQLVPAIAGTAASVTVFQRTPQWVAPFDKCHQAIPDAMRYLLAQVPLYQDWYRIRLAWAFNDLIHPALQKDPDWPHPERSVSGLNDYHREFFTAYIREQLGDRQDLLDKVVPDYPPYGKRMLLDNGWYAALRRDDVRLVTDAIAEVRAHSVVTTAGDEHEVDVLVWATGFDVINFLAPMEIVGRSGTRLHDRWGDDARAYLGTAIPDLPNFFCLYGPNAQFGHGGSLITIMDRQVNYVLSVLAQMFEADLGAVEVRADVHDEYNARVDAAHERMVWTHRGMENYYRNSRGRVVAINPFRIVDFWPLTERADLDDFVIEPRRS
jgi:4-hydroxyacetophenone monooxygenase